MAERPRDALLQPPRVGAAPQHLEVVVALEHQGVAAGERLLDVRGGRSDIGEHPKARGAVREHELHRRVPPTSATRQLPLLPLASEANRTNGYFSCSSSRLRMRCAVREPSVPPSLLSTLTRLPSGSCFTSTRKCSALVLESSELNSREKKPRSRSFLPISASGSA